MRPKSYKISLLQPACVDDNHLHSELSRRKPPFSRPLPDVIQYLACGESEPLIRMQISSYLKEEKPVQMTLIYVRAENFHHQADLNYVFI